MIVVNRKLRNLAGVCSITVTLVLSGCSFNPFKPIPEVTESDIAQRDAQLAALKPWRALGSLVVDSQREGTFNASFAWDANESGFDIRLIGPLGLKIYRVIEDSDGATLFDGDNETRGQTAESLLRDVIGVTIPLVEMQDWVVGLQGTAKQAKRDRSGRLSNMVIDKDNETRWRVDFERYSKVDDLDLPKLIVVSNEGIDITLSVQKWTKSDVPSNTRLVIPGIGSI